MGTEGIRMLQVMAQKAADQDGLSAVDKRKITAQFGRTPADRTKVAEVIKIFDDLVVDTGEHQRLVTLLGLDAEAQLSLNVIVGSDGKELFRQREQYVRVSKLIKELKDSDVNVRLSAAHKLGKFKDPRIVPVLCGVLLRDKDAEVRMWTAGALKNIKDPSAVPALIVALKDSADHVRWWAALALEEIKDPRAAPALFEALRDSFDQVRFTAARALRGIIKAAEAWRKATSAIPWFIANLKNSNEFASAIQALVDIGAAAVPALIVALKDRHIYVRMGVAQALGRIAEPRAMPALIEALKDRDFNVRASAEHALRQFDDPRAAAALKAAGY